MLVSIICHCEKKGKRKAIYWHYYYNANYAQNDTSNIRSTALLYGYFAHTRVPFPFQERDDTGPPPVRIPNRLNNEKDGVPFGTPSFSWWRRRDLPLRGINFSSLRDRKSTHLSVSAFPMVETKGFEPSTSRMRTERSPTRASF